MRILIIGASQGTGALAVKEALARGHDVTAFARSPQKLGLEHPKLKKVQGDFHDKSSVANVTRGQDAVIVTASSTTLKGFKQNPNYFSEGTRLVIDAMRAEGVKRLVVLSAFGTGESRRAMSFLIQKVVVDWILKLPFQDHERQEKMVRESGLDWVIARPGRLTNGVGQKRYQKKATLEKVPASIARADVADFLVEAAEGNTWVQKAVQLGG